MTALAAPTATGTGPRRAPARWDRRIWVLVSVVALGWSVSRAGYDLPGTVNAGGWGQVGDFFAAMFTPELSWSFVRLTVREAGVTVAYALLGTVLSLVIGLVGGLLVAERMWRPLAGRARWARWGWRTSRLLFAVPRSMHEVVFGLVLVSILGVNPLVAVLAIGIPFGAVTAKVFSELLDEAPLDAERAMRASGAGRITAAVFGVFPHAMGDLLSYGFYRFECAVRSAAVLGIIGAGGLGFQLSLSFTSLDYEEMWTMLWALIIVSGIADQWSSMVRRRRNTAAVEMRVTEGPPRRSPRRDPMLTGSVALCAVAVPFAWWRLEIDVTTLWADRARDLGSELARDAWPPQIGPGGLGQLVADAVDTIALAVLALAFAWTFASLVAFVARRTPPRRDRPLSWLLAAVGFLSRLVLLIARSIPPPVWAFLAVLVLFSGIWPGAVALGIYNLGVLGRLQAEVVENLDDQPSAAMRAAGASGLGTWAYSTVPAVSGRFVALGLYRWEVAIRETVMVGVVGAAGLGRRLDEQTSSFDYRGILATLVALLVVTVVVDLASAAVRRTLR